MKVLYLAYMRLPTERAHGVQIMKTCEALSREGVVVELVVPTRRTHITQDPFDFYGISTRFTVTRLSTPDLVRFGRLGFLLSILWFSEKARWLRRFWDSGTVIYSRDAFILAQYLLLGRRLVYEAHAAPSLLSAFVARHAHAVVVITESLREAYAAKGVSREKLFVAHDGADFVTITETRESMGMPEGTVVTYAGSRRAGKGVEVVEAATPHIRGSVYVVSGKSPAAVRQILGLSDVVVVPNSDKYLSSRTYTSPMKLFEALVSGARVVASDVPAIREVVDERAVWFFTPDDPLSLAEAVHRALTDPAASQKVAHAKEVAARYTWAERARAIVRSFS